MTVPFLRPSQAARRHGLSAKALRLYEARGLVSPGRTPAGWRAYGPDDMARVAEIASLRSLGLSLKQVAGVLGGDTRDLEAALAGHQAKLESQAKALARQVERVSDMRASLTKGLVPSREVLADLTGSGLKSVMRVDLTLPWPWGGEAFSLLEVRALNFIIGPLGSGKTRLAKALADAIPGAIYLDMERSPPDPSELASDPAWDERTRAGLEWLSDDGAGSSDALTALVAAIEKGQPAAIVVDMVEEGLDHHSQEAVIAWLRRRAPSQSPLFLMTRSNAILDLAAMGDHETLIYCPPNHSPPFQVAPIPGAYGYESVAACLSSPAARARSAKRPAEAI